MWGEVTPGGGGGRRRRKRQCTGGVASTSTVVATSDRIGTWLSAWPAFQTGVATRSSVSFGIESGRRLRRRAASTASRTGDDRRRRPLRVDAIVLERAVVVVARVARNALQVAEAVGQVVDQQPPAGGRDAEELAQ